MRRYEVTFMHRDKEVKQVVIAKGGNHAVKMFRDYKVISVVSLETNEEFTSRVNGIFGNPEHKVGDRRYKG